MKLKTLKTYIKTHSKTGFIWPSKFSADTLILFDKKPDSNFYLCVDYRGLNNLTIKNQYPLPLIGESLNRLGRAKRFTQLDLTVKGGASRLVSWSPITTTLSARGCSAWMDEAQIWSRARSCAGRKLQLKKSVLNNCTQSRGVKQPIWCALT